MIEDYVENVFSEIVKGEVDKEKIAEQLMQKFKKLSMDMCTTERWKAACRIVDKKLVNDNLAFKK